MKMISFGVIGGLLLGTISSSVIALPTVESRNGEPNVRSSSSSMIEQPIHGSTDDRAARLTLKQVEALQQEVSELRGLVETQQHEIQQLKKSQQDLYLDLDKRLNTVKGGGSSKTEPVTLESHDSIELKPTAPIKPIAEVVPLSVPPLAQESSVEASETSEKDPYQFAYQLVQTKRYPEAIVAFQSYITRFPDGAEVANANYWLGELYMVEWQGDKTRISLLDNATQAFLNVTTHFPNHEKASDSLLKLGMIEVDKNNFKMAKHYFTDLKARYPHSTAARIAKNRLQRLN